VWRLQNPQFDLSCFNNSAESFKQKKRKQGQRLGFRKGRVTREAIGVSRTLCERSIEHDQEVYICFVDFEKAFDRGDWKIMMGY